MSTVGPDERRAVAARVVDGEVDAVHAYVGGRSRDAGGDRSGRYAGEEIVIRPIGQFVERVDALGQVAEQQWAKQAGPCFGDVDVGVVQALVRVGRPAR